MSENKLATVSRAIVRQIERLAEFNEGSGDSMEFHENCRTISSLTETLLHMQDRNNLIDFSFTDSEPKGEIRGCVIGAEVYDVAEKIIATLKESSLSLPLINSALEKAQEGYQEFLSS